jgi:hypothetical protein
MAKTKKRRKTLVFSLIGVVVAGLAAVAAFKKREVVITVQTEKVARRNLTEIVVANGKIQPEFVSRLQEVGGWLKQYGDSVYGTRGGPVTPRPWGVTTRRGNRIYLHVLDWPDPVLAMPGLGGRVKSATAMKKSRRMRRTASACALR